MPNDISQETIRREFYDLVHREFGGDLDAVEIALSSHPARKATRRTIQSWLIKGNAVSRRKCPNWALTQLEEYVREHPDRLERIQAHTESDRSFGNKKGFGLLHAETTYSEGNSMAERRIRQERELTARLEEAPLSKLPETLSKELLHLMREVEALSLEHQVVIAAIDSADEKTTVYDLKKTILAQRLFLHSGRLTVSNTEKDIKVNQGEFASDDGTLPRSK